MESFFKGYSKKVIDHFMEPRNNYEMTDANGVGQAGDPSCGDAVGIYIKVEEGLIRKASFVVMGCVGAIASSSMTTVLIEGKGVEEAYRLTPEEIAEWAYFLTVTNTFCTGQSILVDGGEAINYNFVWKN